VAAKGGGAWKVAYADFVTAMMAFFLVMWICGQDQQIRRGVSYYFQDPFNTTMVGTSKSPSRTGSTIDLNTFGSVPQSDSVALGRGRKAFSSLGERAPATKLVNDWLQSDEQEVRYWTEMARKSRQAAELSKEVIEKKVTVEQVAATELSKLMKYEMRLRIAGQAKGIQRELLLEMSSHVNWLEIAEDLVSN
jgi:flagellar motor protein MotB